MEFLNNIEPTLGIVLWYIRLIIMIILGLLGIYCMFL